MAARTMNGVRQATPNVGLFRNKVEISIQESIHLIPSTRESWIQKIDFQNQRSKQAYVGLLNN